MRLGETPSAPHEHLVTTGQVTQHIIVGRSVCCRSAPPVLALTLSYTPQDKSGALDTGELCSAIRTIAPEVPEDGLRLLIAYIEVGGDAGGRNRCMHFDKQIARDHTLRPFCFLPMLAFVHSTATRLWLPACPPHCRCTQTQSSRTVASASTSSQRCSRPSRPRGLRLLQAPSHSAQQQRQLQQLPSHQQQQPQLLQQPNRQCLHPGLPPLQLLHLQRQRQQQRQCRLSWPH